MKINKYSGVSRDKQKKTKRSGRLTNPEGVIEPCYEPGEKAIVDGAREQVPGLARLGGT